MNLIGSQQINAFCMPGGKIAFYTGILDKLKLTDDRTAAIMGHEMAHALREHARERLAKRRPPTWALRLGSQLLGLGDLGNAAASLGAQLLTLKFSRHPTDRRADLVGLELAARAGYLPDASVSLWQKMGKASGSQQAGLGFCPPPSGPDPHPRVAAKRAQRCRACTRRCAQGGLRRFRTGSHWSSASVTRLRHCLCWRTAP